LTAPIQSSKQQQQQQQKQENNKIIIVQKKSEPKSESNKPKSAEIEYAEDFDQDNDAEDGQENISKY
jgi:hypothetical protein